MMEEDVVLELKKIANLMKRTIDQKINIKVTNTQCMILNFIYDNNNRGRIVYQKDIEDFFEIRRSSVCEILNGLEKNGLIKRCSCDSDLRIKEIKLEQVAINLVFEFREFFDSLKQKIIQNISKPELETFCLVLKKMRENLEGLC